MYKKKNLRMSHEGFFKIGTQREFIFGDFFLDVNFLEYFK
jgi:hypothetical protein